MSTIAMSLSSERKIIVRDVAGANTPQKWIAGIEVDWHTTLYLTRSEVVDLYAALAVILKGETK